MLNIVEGSCCGHSHEKSRLSLVSERAQGGSDRTVREYKGAGEKSIFVMGATWVMDTICPGRQKKGNEGTTF